MTLPYERTSAVIRTREFLLALASKKIKRIPPEVREEAGRLLRHYPGSYDIDQVAEVKPDVFGRAGEE